MFHVQSIGKLDHIYPIHEIQKERLKRDFQIGNLMAGKLEKYSSRYRYVTKDPNCLT